MTIQIGGLVIIADDLTGALDAAAPFRGAATRVAVATRPEGLAAALALGAEVTAVSTRSREMAPERAGEVVGAVLRQVAGRRVFKKVDSRLKGPLEGELSAFGGAPLVVAPAIPGFGRVVADGWLSGFGLDAPLRVAGRLGALAAGAWIPDCRSDADLDRVVADAGAGTVLVGARGLAAALARAAGIVPAVPRPVSGKVAVCVGSTDPITREQVRALGREGHMAAPDGRWDGAVPETDVRVLQVTGDGTDPADAVARRLAASFLPLARDSNTLVLTGGETAEAVLDALEIAILDLEGEILPGLPLSRAGAWRIVTKSGGFGEPDTLVRLVAGGEMDRRT